MLLLRVQGVMRWLLLTSARRYCGAFVESAPADPFCWDPFEIERFIWQEELVPSILYTPGHPTTPLPLLLKQSSS